MTRTLRLVAAAIALLAALVVASPVSAAAADGSTYGACVARHATIEGGFSGDHNPGMHRGFAGWAGCPD